MESSLKMPDVARVWTINCVASFKRILAAKSYCHSYNGLLMSSYSKYVLDWQ